MNAKYIIASIGIIGWIAYTKLSNYLKENKVEAANYLRAETGETFFLNVDISESSILKMPFLKWSVDKINLIVDNAVIATSLPKIESGSNMAQEFTPVKSSNIESLKAGATETPGAQVEVIYKTIAGLKIKHKYNVNYLTPGESNPFTTGETTHDNITPQETESCTCELI